MPKKPQKPVYLEAETENGTRFLIETVDLAAEDAPTVIEAELPGGGTVLIETTDTDA